MQVARKRQDVGRNDVESERTCVVCRSGKQATKMVRLGLLDGRVAPVVRGQGRGAYLCAARSCLSGLSSRALSRVFRAPVEEVDPESMMVSLHSLAERRLLETIGLARRQRELDCGVDKVDLHSSVLLVATDLSQRSGRRFGSLSRSFKTGSVLGAAAGMGWVGAMTFRSGRLADRAAYWLTLWYETRPAGSPCASEGEVCDG